MKHILYSGTRNASSWAMRAWLALREQGIEFEEHIVDLRRPQRFRQLARIGEIAPPAAVPVLVNEDVTIFDSFAIMEYANEIGPRSLLPTDVNLRNRARSFVAWQHAGLSNICPKISFESSFYPDRRPLTEPENDECARLFQALEAELFAYGGPYLFGELSLADLALAPTVIRLDAHDADLDAWPLTKAWFETLLARDTVQEWLDEARPLPHIWFDDYVVA